MTETTVGEHDCTGIPLCSSSSFLQGLLIGLWYATLTIRYRLTRLLLPPEVLFIYQVVTTGLVLLSLVMYVCALWFSV